MSKNKLFKYTVFTAAVIGGISLYNKSIIANAVSNCYLSTNTSRKYPWKLGNINYSVIGSGSPVLLIHDINPINNLHDWDQIIQGLANNHTVYTLDLLGCGLSEKPALSYTSFLYSQLITDFIKDVITCSTDIITHGNSLVIALSSSMLEPTLIKKIILINPVSYKDFTLPPNRVSRFKKAIYELPVIGTYLYNRSFTKEAITRKVVSDYFYDKKLLKKRLINQYYESCHQNNAYGRFLYSSIVGNYFQANINLSLSRESYPLYLICSDSYNDSLSIIDDYQKASLKIQYSVIQNSKYLPQYEHPEKVCELINQYLQ